MADDEALFTVDGKGYSVDDLTFREQRELRKLVRELVDDPTAELVESDLMDVVPVAVFLVRRRGDDTYTLEQALDLKWDDLHPKSNGNGNGNGGARRPTKPKPKPGAKAT